jgi:hypothetical protein
LGQPTQLHNLSLSLARCPPKLKLASPSLPYLAGVASSSGPARLHAPPSAPPPCRPFPPGRPPAHLRCAALPSSPASREDDADDARGMLLRFRGLAARSESWGRIRTSIQIGMRGSGLDGRPCYSGIDGSGVPGIQKWVRF